MRISPPLLKSSASSSRWLARQSKDPYVRLRGASSTTPDSSTPAYRSRSSFKLLSLAAKHPILLPSTKSVVDLGAAPGGWSQVAAHLLKVGRKATSRVLDDNGSERDDRSGRARKTIVAVDILGMEPIAGVEVIQGDFLSEDVRDQVRSLSLSTSGEEGVDTVLSDMMAPMTGNRTRDVSLSLDLCSAATVFARDVLDRASGDEPVIKKGGKRIWPGGNLVMKFFAHPDLDEFRKIELDPWFSKVVVEKPKESRSESSEAYFVCLGFKGDPAHR